jgi:CHAD domain-containing protein
MDRVSTPTGLPALRRVRREETTLPEVQREVERKYTVGSEFVLPSLAALPGVAGVSQPETYRLEAVYYDSEDLRLAHRKITLRRRSGGPDDGWHLKLPVKAGERDEFRSPLDEGAATDTNIGEGAATEQGTGESTDAESGHHAAGEAPEAGVAGEAAAEAGGDPAGAGVAGEAAAEAGPPGPQPAQPPQPPEELTDLVLVHLRGAPLQPVARLVTTRTAWRLRDSAAADLAEVVDDDVSAETLGRAPARRRWREVEVELAEGDSALLDQLGKTLTAAGATPSTNGSKLAHVLGPALDATRPGTPRQPSPPGWTTRKTPAGEIVRIYLAAQLEALFGADPRVRLDEPEGVHKMRVAARRFRSTLRTFAPLFDPEVAAHLDGELRDLAGALSGARDAEVQIAYFDSRVDDLPADLVHGPVKESIDARLSSGLASSRDEALTMLRSDRYLALVDALADLVGAEWRGKASKPAGKVLPKLVSKADRRLTRKVATAAEAPAGPSRDVVLHSARKQAKRLRYAAEAVVPLYGKDAASFARIAENIQELLGTHQDATVARGLLHDWGAQAQADGEPTAFTLGLLLGLEECRARTVERDFFDYWPKASRRRHRRWLN